MNRWITRAEAAAHASVSPRTISRWMQDGLRHARIHNKSVRIRISDLDEWMDRFCVCHVDVDQQVKDALVKARKKLASMMA